MADPPAVGTYPVDADLLYASYSLGDGDVHENGLLGETRSLPVPRVPNTTPVRVERQFRANRLRYTRSGPATCCTFAIACTMDGSDC